MLRITNSVHPIQNGLESGHWKRKELGERFVKLTGNGIWRTEVGIDSKGIIETRERDRGGCENGETGEGRGGKGIEGVQQKTERKRQRREKGERLLVLDVVVVVVVVFLYLLFSIYLDGPSKNVSLII